MNNDELILELDRIVKEYKETLSRYLESTKLPESVEDAVIGCVQSIGCYETSRERE